MLGDGLQGKVYLASTGGQRKAITELDGASDVKEDYFAIKVYDKPEFKSFGLMEFNVLKSIKSHPNIVKV